MLESRNEEKLYKTLIYVSEVSDDISYSDAQDILNRSYSNNMRKDVKGVLVYRDHHFIQCLEGRVEVVDALYARIAQDIRHKNVKVIGEKLLDERYYDSWNMANASRNAVVDEIFQKHSVGFGSSLYKAQFENMYALLKELVMII
jgi:hypothetical protein